MFSRRFSAFRLLLLLGIVFITNACTKDEGQPLLTPSITFNGANGALTANDTVIVGSNISFNVTFSKGQDGKKIKNIRITRNLGDGNFVPVTISYVSPTPSNVELYSTSGIITDINADTYNVMLLPHTSEIPGIVVYRFYVEDRDGNKISRDIAVTWQPLDVAPTPPIYYVLTLDTGSANVFSVRDSALAPARGRDVAAAQQGNYDIYYFISSINGPNFVTTDEADNPLLTNFTLANYLNGTATRIRTTSLTANDFISLDDQSELQGHYTNGFDQVIGGWSNTNPAPAVGSRVAQTDNLATGKVVAFNAPGGRYGLILINNATPTGMNISIKVMR